MAPPEKLWTGDRYNLWRSSPRGARARLFLCLSPEGVYSLDGAAAFSRARSRALAAAVPTSVAPGTK
jgi:hypothetical protein